MQPCFVWLFILLIIINKASKLPRCLALAFNPQSWPLQLTYTTNFGLNAIYGFGLSKVPLGGVAPVFLRLSVSVGVVKTEAKSSKRAFDDDAGADRKRQRA